MYNKFFKRFFDIMISLLVLPFFFLLLLIVVPILYFNDRGPIFYIGLRLGKNARIFKMYKFRTMKVNTPDIRNEDGSTFNSEIDHRLTSFGKILRKLSIDEIPQILNVIKGDMSLIGPRPDMPDAIDLYGEKYISKLEVRPGITGLNQAHFRNSADLETRFKNDVYYVRNYSFLLDAKIFVKTILVVLSKKNIYK